MDWSWRQRARSERVWASGYSAQVETETVSTSSSGCVHISPPMSANVGAEVGAKVGAHRR